jgi:hypothetical protein
VTSSAVDVFAEPELVELLSEKPELLAFADAIAETQAPTRRSWLPRIALVAVAAAAAVALLVTAPWRGPHEPSLVDRALAAVGAGPVLHAVIETKTGLTSIELASGREQPILGTMEIWFDRERKIEHTLSRIDGQIQDDTLSTPSGITSLRGTELGGPKPVLDPALAKSIDGYREALASGEATRLGDGSIDGRAVTWLKLAPSNWGEERVAIDKETSEPARVETSWNGHRDWTYEVRSIESLPEGGGDFRSPVPSTAPQPDYFMREPMPIDPKKATAVIPDPLTLDSAFEGLPLTRVSNVKLSTGFKPGANRQPIVSHGLEFEYGSDSPRDGRPHVWLEEAEQAHLQYGWFRSPAPASGELIVGSQGGPGFGGQWSGLMVKDGIYVTILASDRALLLEAAGALGPTSRGR